MNGVISSTIVEIATDLDLSAGRHGVICRVAKQSHHRFERNKWLYILTMPVFWFSVFWVMCKKAVCNLAGLPSFKTNCWWVDGLGEENRAVKDGAASWKALDIIYNHRFGMSWRLSHLIDDFWIGMINAQAVRNRLKLVKLEIRRAIMAFDHGQEIRLISLACGSAQGIIEVMAEFKKEGIVVRTILLDIDQSALDYATELAKKHGVSDQISIVKSSAAQVVRVARDFHPHIIEMLGLLDYIPQDKAIRLCNRIRGCLVPRGIFLTCNVCHNMEMYFLKWVIDWSMIYRTPAELAEVVSEAGFGDYRLIYEPLKIHGLVVAYKGD